MNYEIEICCFSLESCLVAEKAGADRIELCGGFSEGGTTPSLGLVSVVKQRCQIPIYVMIRPRGGDFLYTDTEWETILADVQWAKQAGADGLVAGFLTAEGHIDQGRWKAFLDAAAPLPVTFHRAFDMTPDPFHALDDLLSIGCTRILTSGQQPSVALGIPLLQQLQERAGDRARIMAGAGIKAELIPQLDQAGIRSIHLTGKGAVMSGMKFRQPRVSMASIAWTDEYIRFESKEEPIRRVREEIDRLTQK